MQKNCWNDLQRATATDICTIHTLVQVLSHPQHYAWCEQVILQDYSGGSSVVGGRGGALSVATILGPGRPSMAATLGLGRPIPRGPIPRGPICRDHQWHDSRAVPTKTWVIRLKLYHKLQLIVISKSVILLCTACIAIAYYRGIGTGPADQATARPKFPVAISRDPSINDKC